jgi:hypothetical protein
MGRRLSDSRQMRVFVNLPTNQRSPSDGSSHLLLQPRYVLSLAFAAPFPLFFFHICPLFLFSFHFIFLGLPEKKKKKKK